MQKRERDREHECEREKEPQRRRARRLLSKMPNVYTPTTSSGVYNAVFKEIAAELDSHNELRERVIKASRDTTYQSKKAIFALHRIKSSTREETLSAGAAALSDIRELIATRIASELDATTYQLLHRSFSPGMQEYIEAAVFHAYLRDGALATLPALSREVSDACAAAEGVRFQMHVDPADYVLGVADATGELMRLAVAAAGRGDTHVCFEVRQFLNALIATMGAIKLPGRAGRDMNFKMSVMRQSGEKVEAACFNAVMRRAEFGENVAPASVAVEAAVQSAHAAGGAKRGRANGAARGATGRAGRRDAGDDGEGREKRQRVE